MQVQYLPAVDAPDFGFLAKLPALLPRLRRVAPVFRLDAGDGPRSPGPVLDRFTLIGGLAGNDMPQSALSHHTTSNLTLADVSPSSNAAWISAMSTWPASHCLRSSSSAVPSRSYSMVMRIFILCS